MPKRTFYVAPDSSTATALALVYKQRIIISSSWNTNMEHIELEYGTASCIIHLESILTCVSILLRSCCCVPSILTDYIVREENTRIGLSYRTAKRRQF